MYLRSERVMTGQQPASRNALLVLIWSLALFFLFHTTQYLGPVRNAGAKLYVAQPKGGFNKLHHKLMVIDGQVIIAGSFNYTGPATQLNDENIIILGDLETKKTKKASISAQKKLAKYALDEIDRIIRAYGKAI
jgi:phosphatidylserine/phosphatidylglycerophosphate/cardiolipin synthase-like enzyme